MVRITIDHVEAIGALKFLLFKYYGATGNAQAYGYKDKKDPLRFFPAYLKEKAAPTRSGPCLSLLA